MTGLTTETSEQLLNQNDGIYGHYVPHVDFITDEKAVSTNTGNRIATVLFYVSSNWFHTTFPLHV